MREDDNRYATDRGAAWLGTVSAQQPEGSRGTIVVADDDCATRLLLSRVLTRASFVVYAVENGALACAEVRLRRPDLVLLDWIMPVMDGREAVRLLKADEQTRSIPIVMLTTHSRREERLVAIEAGVQDFLTKPFDPRELIERIDVHLRDRARADHSDTTADDAAPVSGPIQTV